MNLLYKIIILFLIICVLLYNKSLSQVRTTLSFSMPKAPDTAIRRDLKPIGLLVLSSALGMRESSSGDKERSRRLFCLPLEHLHVTSPYGKRLHPILHRVTGHNGVDLRAKSAPVYSFMSGKVKTVKYNKHAGIYIVISHEEGVLQSIYCHLSHVSVFPGEKVKSGMRIGISGKTGRVTGPHLHFAIKWNGHYLNPQPILKMVEKDDKSGISGN